MLEQKSKIKSGLLAVALGVTTTFSWSNGLSTPLNNPAFAQAPPVAAVPGVPQVDANVTALRAAADQALTRAREAIASKDPATAEKILADLATRNIPYRESDDTPRYVEALLQQYKSLAQVYQTKGDSEAWRRQYALFLLDQADGFYRKGIYGTAELLAKDAAQQGARFNEAEIAQGREPQAMLKRIEGARLARKAAQPSDVVANDAIRGQMSAATRQELAAAIQALGKARELIRSGQPGSLDAAEQMVHGVLRANLDESLFPQGSELPSRMRAEIAAIRQGRPVAPAQHPTLQATNAVYNQTVDQTQIVPVSSGTGTNASFVQPDSAVAIHPIGAPVVAQPNLQVGQPAMGPALQPTAPLDISRQAAPQHSLVDQEARNQRAAAYMLSNEVMRQISDATSLTRKGDPESAMKVLDQIRVRVEESNVDPQTKLQFTRAIDSAMANTAQFLQRNAAQLEQKQINEQVRAAHQAEIDERVAMEKQLKTYVDETAKLLEEGKLEEAVLMAKKAKQFAPDEPVTDLLVHTTKLNVNIQQSQRVQAAKEEGWNAEMLATDRASAVPVFGDQNIVFDQKVWEKYKKRKGHNDLLVERRPEAEREIIRKLEMPVLLNIDRPMTLSQMVQYLEGQTGVPMWLDLPSLQSIDVKPDRMIPAQPLGKEIKLKSALSLILQQVGLAYVIENEVLKITSIQRARGTVYPEIYYIGDLANPIPNFDGTNNPSSFDKAYEKAMQRAVFGRGGAGRNVGSDGYYADNYDPRFAGMASMNDNIHAQINVPIGGSTGMLNGAMNGYGAGPAGGYGTPMMPGVQGGGSQADFESLIELIETVVAPESWSEDGVGIMEYYGNMSLIIRQTEEVHAEIVELLNQLRKLNDLQVSVEVRFITLSDAFYEQIGLQFNATIPNASGASRMGYQPLPGSESGNNDNNNNNNNNNNDNNNTATQQVKGNNNIVGLSAPNVFTSDYSIRTNQALAVTPAFGGIPTQAGLNMGFAILSDIEAYFFLQAAQGDTRSNVMEAPKINIFNGQMGSIQDASQTPFVTSVIPVVGDFAAAYQPVIVILNEGSAMTVQGVVSNNRQFVRLTVNPSFSKITRVNQFKFVGNDEYEENTESSHLGAADVVASTDEKKEVKSTKSSSSGVTVQLPVIANLSVQTTVSVPDGGTILLGGIKRLSEGRNEVGTPILNKIPYLNRLFMNTAIGRDTQSIMMMVTPRIIIQEEEEEALTGMRTGGP